MAESDEHPPKVDLDDDTDATPGYKPPAEKSMDAMLQLDAEDESLQKYKQQLLGSAAGAESIFCKPTSVLYSLPEHVILVMDFMQICMRHAFIAWL